MDLEATGRRRGSKRLSADPTRRWAVAARLPVWPRGSLLCNRADLEQFGVDLSRMAVTAR